MCAPHFLPVEKTGRARSKRHARRGISVSPSWTSPSNDTKRGLRPPLWKLPHGAAAGREAGRIDKHPGMRYYVAACGINVGGQERYSAPGWSWANLRKAGYQPFASPNLPGRASLDQAAFSSTVHGPFSLARPTGPPRKPSEAVFVGRGERSGAVRALPFRRGECSAAFFDDNGGCNAHAASLRQQKRTGPFGPALLRRKQKPAFIPRASPGRYAAHPAASG